MKRYEIRAFFDDPDFGEVPTEVRKHFFMFTAINNWHDLEDARKVLREGHWHYRLIDTKTGETLKP